MFTSHTLCFLLCCELPLKFVGLAVWVRKGVAGGHYGLRLIHHPGHSGGAPICRSVSTLSLTPMIPQRVAYPRSPIIEQLLCLSLRHSKDTPRNETAHIFVSLSQIWLRFGRIGHGTVVRYDTRPVFRVFGYNSRTESASPI